MASHLQFRKKRKSGLQAPHIPVHSTLRNSIPILTQRTFTFVPSTPPPAHTVLLALAGPQSFWQNSIIPIIQFSTHIKFMSPPPPALRWGRQLCTVPFPSQCSSSSKAYCPYPTIASTLTPPPPPLPHHPTLTPPPPDDNRSV